MSGQPAVSERAADMSRETETCHVIHSFSTTRCDLTPRRSGRGARAGTGEGSSCSALDIRYIDQLINRLAFRISSTSTPLFLSCLLRQQTRLQRRHLTDSRFIRFGLFHIGYSFILLPCGFEIHSFLALVDLISISFGLL